MRFFELLGNWNSLRAFFFTFKALDTVVSLFLFCKIVIQEAGRPGIFVYNRIILIASDSSTREASLARTGSRMAPKPKTDASQSRLPNLRYFI